MTLTNRDPLFAKALLGETARPPAEMAGVRTLWGWGHRRTQSGDHLAATSVIATQTMVIRREPVRTNPGSMVAGPSRTRLFSIAFGR
jgi:hypothetical protein